MSLREDVQGKFKYLFDEHGFAWAECHADSNQVVLSAPSDIMRIRFSVDRADFFVDIAVREYPGRWIGLYEALEKLRASGHVTSVIGGKNRMFVASAVLQKHISILLLHTSEVA